MNYGKTRITICKDELDLGGTAAGVVSARLRQLLAGQDEVRMVLAAGQSQGAFLESLAQTKGIDWGRVVCFNIDDFWDVRMPEEFTCGWQTRRQFYDKVPLRAFHLVRFNAADPQAECRRFESLLREKPLDILCQGIGTSGHLALDEPGQTDFNDPQWVRLVDVAEQSKRQLREDPNFKALGYIPEKGITMTVPAILIARFIYTIVPLALKRPIITRLLGTVTPTTDLPASILSRADGEMFLDRDSCPETMAK